MAVETTTDFSGPYTTNGATTVFPFTFISMAADEVAVILRDEDGADTVVSTALYSVTRNANGTGSVVFAVAPVTGSTLYVYSNVAFTQSIAFEDGSGWRASPVNEGLDRSAAKDIWLKARVDRSLLAPLNETLSPLPAAANRLGKFLAFDAAGDPVVSSGTGADDGLRTDVAASGGSALVGHIPSGTGAIATTLPVIFNRQYVWLEDYTTNQQAVDASIARGADIKLRQGVNYNWPSQVTANSKINIDATGATITVPNAITALRIQTGADGSRVKGGTWLYTGPTVSGYNQDAHGVLFTGTLNGAGVAPSRLDDVGVEDCVFSGFGGGGAEYRYTTNSFDKNVRVMNAGYYGIFCYSVDTHHSTGLIVNGLSGQLDTGVAATSELNAYGFTATALTGSTGIDRVQNPVSRNVFVTDSVMINIKTWHAIDGHGPDNMVVRNPTILNCRRGVIFTGLTQQGTINSRCINAICVNTLAQSATNVNGTSQKGEAFWDIGPSTTYRNSRNRFEGCYSFGHGSPAAGHPSDGLGAVTIANANDGYYGIEDEQSFRVGWSFASNIRREPE